MSSDTFTLRVVRAAGLDLDLAITCHTDRAVEATVHFAAQVLADLLGEEQILALLPGADPESPFHYASEWLLAHGPQVIDAASLALHDEVNHPPVELDYHELRAKVRARFQDRWPREPLAVVAEVAVEMERLGEALEFAGEPELYTTGDLDDLLEELVSVQLESAPQASASLRFRVRDPRWIAHLAPGDELGSTASP